MDWRKFTDDFLTGVWRSLDMSRATKEETKATKPEVNGEPTEDQIREEAYYLWEKAGSNPDADPSEFWSQAKKKLAKG